MDAGNAALCQGLSQALLFGRFAWGLCQGQGVSDGDGGRPKVMIP